jgi:putative ABC transport system substrate-binding protein
MKRSREKKSMLFLTALFAGVAALAGTAVAEPSVLIVKSDSLAQYEAPITAFREVASMQVTEIDIAGSREKGTALLKSTASQTQPTAVFALGAKAAYLSKQLMPDTPVVFAMVLGWKNYGLEGALTTGVAVEIPDDVLLTRFKLILPGLKRLGVICGEHTCPLIEQTARPAAEQLGIELVIAPVAHHQAVPGAYRRIRTSIDALWMVPDPLVITRDNFSYLSSRTRHDDVAFLAFSENFVEAGALLSVAPSYATMGAQAAVLVNKMLASKGEAPPVQNPLGSTLVINAETADDLGISMDSATLNMFDRVIESTKTP